MRLTVNGSVTASGITPDRCSFQEEIPATETSASLLPVLALAFVVAYPKDLSPLQREDRWLVFLDLAIFIMFWIIVVPAEVVALNAIATGEESHIRQFVVSGGLVTATALLVLEAVRPAVLALARWAYGWVMPAVFLIVFCPSLAGIILLAAL